MTKEEIEETTKLLLSNDITKAEADSILFDMYKEDLETLNKSVDVDRYEEYSKGYHDGANAAADDINS